MTSGETREQLARGRDPVEVGHAHVHQHDVGPRARAARRRRRVRRRASPTTSIAASLESTAAQAGAHQVVVVDEEHADRVASRRRSRAYGRRARTRKRPSRGAGLEAAAEQRRALAHADEAVAVGRRLGAGRSGWRPSSSSALGPNATSTSALPLPWRAAFVSASWRIR